MSRRVLLLWLYSLFYFSGIAQKSMASRNWLDGAIDLHIHSAPDIVARSITDLEAAQQAQAAGMQAIVLKNHISSTAARAELVNLIIDEITVYGGITLNRSVGGINPSAVENMAKLSPKYGKFVWFPTFDAISNTNTTGLTVLSNGKLSEPALQILALIKRYQLVLATGHLPIDEVLLLVDKSREIGIERIIITHALANEPEPSITQLRSLTAAGAKIELTYLSYLNGPMSALDLLRGSKHVSMEKMAETIRAIGSEHIILSSDLGKALIAKPTEGFSEFIQLLMKEGIDWPDIEQMIKINPEKLLE